MKLCVIPGDGVGREVIPAAVEVLQHVMPDLQLIEADAGWDCFQRLGNALPDETKSKISDAGAALFGAVSSPSKKVEGYRSPIIQMRQHFDLFANLRPTKRLAIGDHFGDTHSPISTLQSPHRLADRAREHTGSVCAARVYARR